MENFLVVKRPTYVGLFMVTLATLMYEILLTRIFSVTMWYHYAFLAISVAMFGMTVGAICVYLLPGYFSQEKVKYHLALSSFFFSLSIVICSLTYLSIPFVIGNMYSMTLLYMVISIPFFFSGICVCLALTRFPHRVGRLYAADLAGAAAGCILLIYTLRITDGPTAIIAIAFLASIGTLLFSTDAGFRWLTITALISILLFAFLTASHTALVHKQSPLLRLIWVKGEYETPPLYEKWNSFSRIKVVGNPRIPSTPLGWGISLVYPKNKRPVKQLFLDIDATASTVLTAFDGDFSKIEHLKYDITNLAHHIRRDAKVLVVGTGGGRDILSALGFGQKSVLGIEINNEIIDTVNERFGDFTGHLDKNPKVTFVNDEARSYITRSKEKFDIIQGSFIDTWAATAAGAFILTENALYTVEAWKVFLEHLTPKGILTFSRWYFMDTPGEMYRLTSLATTSLMQSGVENPRNHIVILRSIGPLGPQAPYNIGTMLVSKEPFSEKDLHVIEMVSNQMKFDVILAPKFSLDKTFATIASGKNLDKFMAAFPLKIEAPTDDTPFFFNMLRFKDSFNKNLRGQGAVSINRKAIFILGILLFIVIGLTFLCIIFPLVLTTKKGMLKGTLPLFIFFASIGFGFMFVEISQMQRLIIFLGHPVYALSVLLFALLLSSGMGSYLSQNISISNSRVSANTYLVLILFVLLTFGILTPYAVGIFRGSTTMVRILVATGILFPIGLFMGMAFPLGMKLASARANLLTPWLWGVNGATSVCASVIAIVIALASSISASYWTGFLCYAVALSAYVWASQKA
jgi:hypothetical protein